MSHCRICRSENNLKYSLKELRRITKKLGNSTKELLQAVPTAQSGNICYDCEDRLHNFNKLLDDDVDVDCEGEMVGVREESPVIVDDDELLYNMFFNRNKGKLLNQRDHEQQLPQASVAQPEFAQNSLGSDGDTEVIEVLTSSRESTPLNEQINRTAANFITNITTATMPALPNKSVAIEIIDLELDDEKKIEKSDDDEIVFRRVEAHGCIKKVSSAEKKPKNKRIRKRRYSESEIKLIASLSLLSSDSESELQVVTMENGSPVKPNAGKINTSAPLTSVTETMACGLCNLSFSDTIALQSHQLTHTSVYCPVCNTGFPVSQRLVHHMRNRHRSYVGSLLSERPKCPQDSAMTIRLRYMQRYTYYECQLCGQIDAVFKNHKSHVITKHEDESKSLKDPMMKELKCHICKEKCGTQYLNLCCHLRREHPDKHAPQLREVTHTHPFGWNAARQRDVESSAKVFQFSTRKSRYFECIICKKVTAGYFKHWKHLNIHSNGSHEKLAKRIEEINQVEAKKMQVEAKKMQIDEAPKNKKLNAEATKAQNKKNAKVSKKQFKKNLDELKQNESKRLATTLQSNEIRHDKPKKLRKLSKKALKAALVKVKVKPVLKRFPTQKYECKFCAQKFKGFYNLNKHQIQKHQKDEMHYCLKCNKVFSRLEQLESHSKEHSGLEKTINPDEKLPRHRHHKRKCRGIVLDIKKSNTNISLDENCNSDSKRVDTSVTVGNGTDLCAQKKVAPANSSDNSMWLKDLLRFAIKQQIEIIYQCQYCSRLFNEYRVLLLHEQGHETRRDVPMIKRIALTVPKES